MEHLEKTLNNTQKILVGLAISVISLLIKMLVEGMVKKL